MERQKTIQGLPVVGLEAVEVQDDGAVVIVVSHEGGELGLLLTPETAEELTGALIERPHSGYQAALAGPAEGLHTDVADHSVEQVGEDAYVLQLQSEAGPVLTLRLGTRRLRRIRDAMTAHLARPPSRRRQ